MNNYICIKNEVYTSNGEMGAYASAIRQVLTRLITEEKGCVSLGIDTEKFSSRIITEFLALRYCHEYVENKEKEKKSQTYLNRKISVIDIFSGISTTALSNYCFSSFEMTMSEIEIRTESINVPCDNMTQTSYPSVQMEQYTHSLQQILHSHDKLQKENARLKRECKEEREKRIIIEAKYEQLSLDYCKLVSTSTIQKGKEDEGRNLLGGISSGDVGKKPKNKSDAEFVPTTQTFKLKIDNHVAFNQAICKAFNYAIEYKLISKDSKQDDFLAVFSGNATEARIRWTSTNGALKYFMSKLKKKGIVDIPKGFGIWQVTRSHFVDYKGKTITVNLANEHAPQNAELKANINEIVATLGIDY